MSCELSFRPCRCLPLIVFSDDNIVAKFDISDKILVLIWRKFHILKSERCLCWAYAFTERLQLILAFFHNFSETSNFVHSGRREVVYFLRKIVMIKCRSFLLVWLTFISILLSSVLFLGTCFLTENPPEPRAKRWMMKLPILNFHVVPFRAARSQLRIG